MTVSEIKTALQDLQRRIYDGEAPGKLRVSKKIPTLKQINQSEAIDDSTICDDNYFDD